MESCPIGSYPTELTCCHTRNTLIRQLSYDTTWDSLFQQNQCCHSFRTLISDILLNLEHTCQTEPTFCNTKYLSHSQDDAITFQYVCLKYVSSMIASYQHSYQHYQLMSLPVDVKVLGTLMSIFVVFATICWQKCIITNKVILKEQHFNPWHSSQKILFISVCRTSRIIKTKTSLIFILFIKVQFVNEDGLFTI